METKNRKDNHLDKNTSKNDTLFDSETAKNPADELNAIFPSSNSDHFNAINTNNNQNQKDNPGKKDNLMPNPDDFDEGDDAESEGKGERTPGL
jgi:hypothetical protein